MMVLLFTYEIPAIEATVTLARGLQVYLNKNSTKNYPILSETSPSAMKSLRMHSKLSDLHEFAGLIFEHLLQPFKLLSC